MSWNEEANIRCLLSFACPQLWSRLAVTDTPDCRHCEQCDRDVHLVRDEEEYFQHAAHGHCVAVPVKSNAASRREGLLLGSPSSNPYSET
jgi:hypothetical protein